MRVYIEGILAGTVLEARERVILESSLTKDSIALRNHSQTVGPHYRVHACCDLSY
jgi:hypothetical protein